jgi:hypothetical protein
MSTAMPGDAGYELTGTDGAFLKRATVIPSRPWLFLFYVERSPILYDVGLDSPDEELRIRKFANFSYHLRDGSSALAKIAGASETSAGAHHVTHGIELSVDPDIHVALEITYRWAGVTGQESIALIL